jgi:uroporphyrinogen decarboxylase
MTHRERVLAALKRQPIDRVPIDLGGNRDSTIHRHAYPRLVAALGLSLPEPALMDRMQQVVWPDPAVLDALDIDLQSLPSPALDDSSEQPQGDSYSDAWGVVRRLPPHGLYYDVVSSPLSGPITAKDVASHPWPEADDPAQFDGFREQALALRQQTDRALCIGIRGSVVHVSQYVRGFEDWYYDAAANHDLMGALMDAILDAQLPVVERTLELVGDLVDIVFVGDDLGAQQALQISPATYRKVIKPRHARVFEAMRRGAPDAFVAYHTCGAVTEVLDDIIELGVQIIHPVQVSASDMDPKVLKRRWGDRLAFWGGVDTQHTLPHGTPEAVRQEVRERIEVLSRGGGYLCGAVHNIQADVPVENILAMFDEAKRCHPPT